MKRAEAEKQARAATGDAPAPAAASVLAAPSAPAAPASAKPARSRSRQFVILAVVVLLGGGAVAYQFWPEATVPKQVAAAPVKKRATAPRSAVKKPAPTPTAGKAAEAQTPEAVTVVVAVPLAPVMKWQTDVLGLRAEWSMFSKPAADPVADLASSPETTDDAMAAWRWLWAVAPRSEAPAAPHTDTTAEKPPASPAAPEVASVKRPPADAAPVDVSKFNVTTIMATPRGAKAVINGHVVGAGQEIDGAKVISIGDHDVELEIGGRRAKINL